MLLRILIFVTGAAVPLQDSLIYWRAGVLDKFSFWRWIVT